MSKQSDSDNYQGWFTAEQLLELCHEHGFQVSRDQLARWHRELAIPAPKRDHRRGGRGSVSMYEPDTPEILLELCRAKRGRTPLDQIVWSLWWESRPAHMSGVRAHMERIAKDFDATVTTVREERPVTTKAKRAPKLVREALQSTTPLRGPMGWIHRSVGTDDWPRFVDTTIEVMTGVAPELVAQDRHVLDRALHVEKAYEVRALDERIRSDDGYQESLGWMATFMSVPLEERALVITDEELCAARDAAKDMMGFLDSFGKVMAWMYKPDGLGYEFASRVVDLLGGESQGQVFLTLLFHGLLKDETSGLGWAELRPTVEQWNEGYSPDFERLNYLAASVPELAAVVTPRSMRRAFTSRRGQEDHIEKVREVREKSAPALDAAIAARPDLFPPKIEEEDTQ